MSKKISEELVQSLLHITDKKEMEAFLHGLLTPQERDELPKRLAIFKMLQAGTPQHEIAKRIGVGIATVTRGSLELKRGYMQKTSWWQKLSSHVGG